MKKQLTEMEMYKMYKAYYSDALNQVKRNDFKKREETKIEGLVSWVELPTESEMYRQGILVGREVM